MKLFSVVLVALASWFWGETAAYADNDWYHYRSDHFSVYSELEEERAEAILRDLEYYRYYMSVLTGTDGAGSPLPLTVYLVRQHRNYKDLIGYRPGFAGVYWVTPHGAVTMAEVEDKNGIYKEDGRNTLFHEYSHHFLHEFGAMNFPRWYSEGFAEYLSTFTIRGSKAQIGNPPLQRFWWLRHQWMPSGVLFAANARIDGFDKSGFHIGAFYAQSWLYTHMIRSDPALIKALGDYLAAINEGEDQKTAFSTYFGMTEEEFGLKARDYWTEKKFPTLVLDFAKIDYHPTWTSQKLNADEIEAMKAQVRMDFLGSGEMGPKLRRFLKKQQEKNPALATSASLHLAKGYLNDDAFEEAWGLLTPILEADPANRDALLLKSELLIAEESKRRSDEAEAVRKKRNIDEDDFDPDDVPFTPDAKKVREAMKAAFLVIKQDKMDSEAYLRFGLASLFTDKVSDNGLKAMRSYIKLVPQNDTARYLYARALYLRGDIAEVVPLLEDIANWSASDWAGRRAQQMLDRIEASRSEASIADTAPSSK